MTQNTLDSMDFKSQEALDRENQTARPNRANPNNLRDQVAVSQGLTNWPTPNSSEHKSSARIRENRQDNLGPVARNWPTPTVSDTIGSPVKNVVMENGFSRIATNGVKWGAKLRDAAALVVGMETWPTPTTQETVHTDIEMTHTGRRKTKDGKNSHSLNLEDTTRINSQTTHQDPQTHPDGSTCSVSCRRLNPLFVEYLMMGKWLIGWTDLKPLGTQSLGRQEQSHSDSVSKGQES